MLVNQRSAPGRFANAENFSKVSHEAEHLKVEKKVNKRMASAGRFEIPPTGIFIKIFRHGWSVMRGETKAK